MKNEILFRILFVFLIPACKTPRGLPEKNGAETSFKTRDSVEFLIVMGGDYQNGIHDIWESPWYPRMPNMEDRYREDSIQWCQSRGLFDSVEIVLAHQTLFKGVLKNFYKPQLGLYSDLVYHATYYNEVPNKDIFLAIINYSRRGYQEASLCPRRSGKPSIFYYYPIKNDLQSTYSYSKCFEKRTQGSLKRADDNLGQ